MNRPKTIREAIQNLSEPSYVDWGTLADALGMHDWYGSSNEDEFDRRFKRHWVVSWICTDTQVGISIITLDSEPVAVTSQTGRKNDEGVYFFSKDIALFGNHDVHYVSNVEDYMCSGWNRKKKMQLIRNGMSQKMREKMKLLHYEVCGTKRILFSHAGLNERYLKFDFDEIFPEPHFEKMNQ